MTSNVQTQFVDSQYQETYPDGIQNHYWNVARELVILSELKSHDVTSADFILDVGCGRGFTVDFLRSKGFDCAGVELAACSVLPSVKKYLYPGTDYKNLRDEIKNKVNIITLLDVLEHVENPIEFLKNFRNTFPKLEKVLITVPARQELWSNYDEHFGHFKRYSKDKLKEEVCSSGFIPIKLKYFFQGLYLPAWLLVKMGKKRFTAMHPPKISWPHKLLGFIFFVESKIAPGFLFGSSLLGFVEVNHDTKK